MKPQTYMNRSGDAVAAIAQQRGIPAGRVVVVYDDMDLPLGRLRLRSGGGSGGHNGIKSISQELGDNSFLRVRVGVGRPDSGMDPVEHVLSGFGEDQNEAVDAAVERAVDATCALINDGLGPAMDRFNRKVVEVAG